MSIARIPQSPQLTDGQRPRKEEHGERVEDDEDERDEVEADRELDPGFTDRFGAAFVACELGRERAAGTEHARRDERHDGKGHDHAEVDDDWQVAAHSAPRLGSRLSAVG